MRILTLANQAYEIDTIPEYLDEDLRYNVLDYGNKQHIDYYFPPLVFLEIFNSPAAVLNIGGNILKMPLDWNVVICDPSAGDPEIIPLTAINDRGFKAFVFNPITGFLPDFLDISIENVYTDYKWYSPKLKQGHILAVPIEMTDNPRCAYFVKDMTKIPELLDSTELW